MPPELMSLELSPPELATERPLQASRGLPTAATVQRSLRQCLSIAAELLYEAATFNEYGRFVLTRLGRELMFDMFGQGAADCA